MALEEEIERGMTTPNRLHQGSPFFGSSSSWSIAIIEFCHGMEAFDDFGVLELLFYRDAFAFSNLLFQLIYQLDFDF